MLRQLIVENIALIPYMDLEFSTGLTILTGETGAGKSIIIDALSLILGDRADATLIRSGTERATVQACFQLPPSHVARQWLQEKALGQPPDTTHDQGGEELFLRRVLSTNGRSRAFVNEIHVPLATLAELGAMLVEIHGQHDHQTLLDPGNHLAILDELANHPLLVHAVKEQFDRWHDIATEQKNLRQRQADAADRQAFLAFQLSELESADLKPEEMIELEQHRSRLVHATRLAQAARNALDWLLENAHPAATLTGRAASELEAVTELDPSLESIATTVRSLQYELDDAGERVRDYLEGLEIDPAQLEALEDRLDLLRRLARKHRREVDQLPALMHEWQAEMAQLDSAEEREKALDQALTLAKEAYLQAARSLGQSRQAATLRLSQAVETQLHDLHMVNARFLVTLQAGKGEPRQTGLEDALFQVSPNPGEPLKPLHLIASGGELSRITLALKTTLAHFLPASTLVFDEVDVGVGGRVAASIGAKMAHIAQERQVLAITHLPQVAAWGTHHLKVEKHTANGQTTVTVTPLTWETRIEELARMLAGEQITAPARQHAQELLQTSRITDASGRDPTERPRPAV
ncbi:MAG: DNA repair protein RecN [Magnetococcales bacterium]|nr:DNA repair protein RecN [Magnetococcales bacterium]